MDNNTILHSRLGDLAHIELPPSALDVTIDRKFWGAGHLYLKGSGCVCAVGWMYRALGATDEDLGYWGTGSLMNVLVMRTPKLEHWRDIFSEEKRQFLDLVVNTNDGSRVRLGQLYPQHDLSDTKTFLPFKEWALTRLLQHLGVRLSFTGEFPARPAREHVADPGWR